MVLRKNSAWALFARSISDFSKKFQHLVFTNQCRSYTDMSGIFNINRHPLRTTYKADCQCHRNTNQRLNHIHFPISAYFFDGLPFKILQHCKHAIYS